MHQSDVNAVFLVQMFGKMLSRIDAAMLATRASEGKHQVGEAALEITLHMMICQPIDALQEGEYLPVFLKETYYRLIQTRQLLVCLVTAGVVSASTVEDISSAVAALVLRNPALEREREDANTQRFYDFTIYDFTIFWLARQLGI